MTRLVSALRINVGTKQKKWNHNLGYRGSIDALRRNVTALITHERIETRLHVGALTRQYTEKLISDAILNGDKHKHTMEMANFWLASVSIENALL